MLVQELGSLSQAAYGGTCVLPSSTTLDLVGHSTVTVAGSVAVLDTGATANLVRFKKLERHYAIL